LVKPSDIIVIVTLAAGAGTAAAIDLRTRRVPNPLTALLASAGVVLAATGLSGVSFGASLVGLIVGLTLMLPGHIFGATGAGDVKLFAATGALIGPVPIAVAFVYTAIAGGVLAVAVAVYRRRRGQLVDHHFAYAPAILVGTFIAALGR
jgi:prepilin peptidase CpaA